MKSHSILPRLIRLRDAPSYLGMDRNKFNKVVRPCLTEIPLGKQAVAFDRLEIDAWIEEYIGRNGRRPKASTFEDDICQNLTNQNAIKCRDSTLKRASGTLKNAVDMPKVAGSGKVRKRLAALRQADAIFTFEEAALRYLEEIAAKPSADKIAMNLDQLFPFIGEHPLEKIHDGTLKAFVDQETKRGIAPKSVNNALSVVSTVLNRAARVWRDESGKPWLKQALPMLSRLCVKGKQAKAYPLSWEEQDRLFQILPRHLADAALYAVNTGCREQEVCQLQWDWEVNIPDLDISVFILPESITKTSTERVVVLNSIARRVIESRRGIHTKFVFTYKDNPVRKLRASAWRRIWIKAQLPTEKGILKGVHNLRHSFGRRLRGVGISLETRKALLGHANGDITTHYSAAELNELLEAVEKIADRGLAQAPTLIVIQRNKDVVGKVSESKKRSE